MRLQPGDVLLYNGSGLYSWIIRIKTWHAVSHVEVYIGDGQSVASRDGLGVGEYPLREDYTHVLRPSVPFQRRAAMYWFRRRANGQPYGWLDLLAFVGMTRDHPGMVCSDFATQFLREGGVPVFNREPSRQIAPFQFLTSELLVDVTDDQPEAA